MTQAGAATFSYDANGNHLSSSTGLILAYNAKNQTTSITPPGGSASAQTYAGAGQLDRASSGGTSFTRSALGLGVQSAGGGSSYFTRDDRGTLIGQRTSAGARYYYLTDIRGSVWAMTDSTGQVVNSYRYDPFGNAIALNESVANPWRFAGEYQDASGLYKIGERFYAPGMGRWTQPDALSAAPDYSYAANDPVNLVDPTGLLPEAFCKEELGENSPFFGFCRLSPEAPSPGGLSPLTFFRRVTNGVCVGVAGEGLAQRVASYIRRSASVSGAGRLAVGSYCLGFALGQVGS